jgi:hypothetical protein
MSQLLQLPGPISSKSLCTFHFPTKVNPLGPRLDRTLDWKGRGPATGPALLAAISPLLTKLALPHSSDGACWTPPMHGQTSSLHTSSTTLQLDGPSWTLSTTRFTALNLSIAENSGLIAAAPTRSLVKSWHPQELVTPAHQQLTSFGTLWSGFTT